MKIRSRAAVRDQALSGSPYDALMCVHSTCRVVVTAFFLLPLIAAAPAMGQCSGWFAGPMSTPGVNNRITVLHQWDSDGPGGNPPVLVAAGDMTASGTTPLSYITKWDGTAWVGVGTGTGAATNALTTLSTGELVAGGLFNTSTGGSFNRIARFNGTAWSSFGTGTNSAVWALAPGAGGSVMLGGMFTQAGSITAGRIARWNPGSSSFSIPGASAGQIGCNDWVWALANMPNGDVIAAGAFRTINNISLSRIARFNGTTWLPLGSGITGSEIYELFVMPNGDLIVSGNFSAAGGVTARNVARWDGVNWHAMGAGFPSPARAFAVLTTGELVAANVYSADFTTLGISKWTGSQWVRIGSANSTIFALSTLPNGDLAVGGSFTQVDGLSVQNFAIYRSGTPLTISMQPSPLTSCLSSPADFSVAASGAGPFSYQWRKDTLPIDPLANPSAATAVLTIPSVQLLDAGSYDCRVTNACGSVASDPAVLTICIGDFNCDGGLDGGDVEIFFQAWETGDPAGDVNGDGGVDGSDVGLFFARWESGC